MKLDDETKQMMEDLGIDVDQAGFDQVGRHFGVDGASLQEMWNKLATAAAEDDPWAGDGEVLRAPFDTPLSVLVLTDELVLDPLMFALVLSAPPDRAMLDAMTSSVAAIAAAETTRDDDHISGWSDAAEATTDQGEPAIQWHLDAAAARPLTIRRVVQALAEVGSKVAPSAVRLVVGGSD